VSKCLLESNHNAIELDGRLKNYNNLSSSDVMKLELEPVVYLGYDLMKTHQPYIKSNARLEAPWSFLEFE
jgi:hypothetical protein